VFLVRLNEAMDSRAALDALYHADYGRIVATVIRLVGDFDLAEDAVQEAFTAAIEQWARDAVPEFPRAWIVQTARHKALDRIRRRSRFADKVEIFADSPLLRTVDEPDYEAADIPDDRLRLIFTCCHPALAPEAQVALTLRTLCGLDTEEIARAFLVAPVTMAQRLVRAKKKIRLAGIPYVVPGTGDISERLESVLAVIYLVFNEGYAATRGESLVRPDLSAEAIRLGRLLRELTSPHTPGEATSLLALMLLHDARRETRLDADANVVLLEEQDRSRWNHTQIREALALVGEASRLGLGQYGIQAAIAAVHCRAARPDETDWREILRLYDLLTHVQPSPVVHLNRAAAVAMVHGPEAALVLVDALAATGDLDDHHLLHSARAELLRRTGSFELAAQSYARALALAGNKSERTFLERRLRDVRSHTQIP
jgi:RNA polymerase sigma-70 factor (ECF subfamily)